MATLLAQTDEKNLIDKLHDLKESYKKKKGFNDEDLQQLKNVLKDIPRLRDVSSTIRVDTLPFFEVIELKQNEMIVKKDNPNVSIYLLVSGKLKKSIHAPWNSFKVITLVQVIQEEEDRKEQDLITLKENFQEIKGLKAFGNFELLQLDKFDKPLSNKWDPCYVYSLESSVIFYLNFDKTYKYMEKTAEAVHYQDKINFLSKNVPGLINQMNSNRDKIIQLFQPMNFIQNQVIIKEGVMPPMAYIIVSGHCYLQSSQIPLKNNIFAEDPKRAKHFISQNRGYLSKTMNSFQLGIVSEDQWIGEELLAMYLQERYEYINNCLEEDDNLPGAKQTWNNQSQSAFKFKPLTLNGFPYSVIAKTNVQAYGITKDDLMFKIGKELQSQINKQAIKKQEWIRKRFAEIQHDVKRLVGQEQSIWNYVDKSKEIGKLYPQANKRTVKTISLKKINEPSIVIEEEPLDLVRMTQQYVLGRAVLQQRLSQTRKSLLPTIQEDSHVSHTDMINFHMNPTQSSPSLNQLNDQRSYRNHERMLSVSDKVAQSMIKRDLPEDSPLKHSFEKVIMGAASCYKYTGDMKLYLPRLIKTIEMDKKLQIINKSGRSQERMSSEKMPKIIKNISQMEIKKVQFEPEVAQTFEKRRSSMFE